MQQERYWWPITLVAVTSVFNFCGRIVAKSLRCCIGPNAVLVSCVDACLVAIADAAQQALSVLRICFVPCFVLYIAGYFTDMLTDQAAIVMVGVFALTNGVVVSSSMALATSSVR